ncbi:hypothetical protein TRFO_28839 [Tritrichomonas foetus]|uniref:Uncharacterized protein n=1 Tax=Tritrichomonas foetus TaxID=1144522 RepID=A0A1J4JXE2_9EUKA|nr:hypothetical protein TRFO_28839 [Tritrichomonas foetus]|eukprot:OHT03659.1 hypothetical protein TRFO_28839 [Tritrichomonas foetus]
MQQFDSQQNTNFASNTLRTPEHKKKRFHITRQVKCHTLDSKDVQKLNSPTALLPSIPSLSPDDGQLSSVKSKHSKFVISVSHHNPSNQDSPIANLSDDPALSEVIASNMETMSKSNGAITSFSNASKLFSAVNNININARERKKFTITRISHNSYEPNTNTSDVAPTTVSLSAINGMKDINDSKDLLVLDDGGIKSNNDDFDPLIDIF